jgi:molecular chaperone DnaK
MSQTINIGIDLGTTNSVIARAHGGKVEVLRNPMSMRETLPSVVAYRKGRILVGDKAREFLERDPENVVGGFKRKMGTADRYFIHSLEQSISPVELSAQVLGALKGFIQGEDAPQAAVVTIPASFDTMQSNATREAGHLAGFSQVVLLQEPIAASLAFANRREEFGRPLGKGQWLVYDLGGGTFDVALVRIKDGEMRVMDHEGDNFLGGGDFDDLIVMKLIVPQLEKVGKFEDLERQLKSASGRHNVLYYKLLLLAEAAKISLSSHESADIEFEATDDGGEEHEVFFSIQRKAFEALIDPYIDQTLSMMERILVRNKMLAEELDFVLMVGGSTYIPHVRERVGRGLGIAVNCDIDPATAVAEGAAHYAATKPIKPSGISLEKTYAPQNEQAGALMIKLAYARTSKAFTEYFTAKVEGDVKGFYYRIVRTDGGFDTGLKRLEARIEEDLPLVTDTYNTFRLTILDRVGNVVRDDLPEIGITQGKYAVTGQPLPQDICIEIDDLENRRTKLEAIFKKNEILPLRRSLTKQVMKTIRQGQDDQIVINLLEGPEHLLPAVNIPIGYIVVNGQNLGRDLVKGSDVEVTVEISESRDLKVTAYLLMTDQEFTNVFSSTERQVVPERLAAEIQQMKEQIVRDQIDALMREDKGLSDQLGKVREELEELLRQVEAMAPDDVTDARYQLDDRKRRLARQLSEMTQSQALENAKLDYFDGKHQCQRYLDKVGTEAEVQTFGQIVAQEKDVLRLDHLARITELSERVWKLCFTVRWRDLDFLRWIFASHLSPRMDEFLDRGQAEELIREGLAASEQEDVYGLQVVINGLFELLPSGANKQGFKFGTGIG